MNQTQSFTLQRGKTLAVQGRRDAVVRILDGKVWLTQHKDSSDHMLGGGQALALNGLGTALIYAFEPTSLTLNVKRPSPYGGLWRTCAAVVLAGFAALSWAQHDHHRMVTPAELKWSDVPSLPPGAKLAVIEGPMNQAAPFTVRLKFPDNYRIPPHFHPAVERVTVLSGTFHMGVGEKFDRKKAQALKAGGIAIMQPKTPHFAWTRGETIVQLHGTGPWGVTYLNPADDPRKQ